MSCIGPSDQLGDLGLSGRKAASILEEPKLNSPLLPSSRIVTSIGAGLGNQMFQYAVARRLAHVNGAELLLYLGNRYDTGSKRTFRLDNFAISGRLAGEAEAGGLRRLSRTRRRLARFLPGLRPPRDPEVVKEETLRFNPTILTLRGNVKLAGAWQCEHYFSDIGDIIRREFTLRAELDARSRETLAHIQAGPSAFIHVRRGDYVTSTKINRLYGTCSPDYYETGLRMLRDRIGAALCLFVFSDDPAWVRKMQIGGAKAVIVDWNADAPERDIALMRACNHAIIANSSFSWWGAWLGDGSERVVIAPRAWFRRRSDYEDIVPERWIRL